MQKVVHGSWTLGVAVAVAGCALTTGTSAPVIVNGARPSALGVPSPGPLGLLPIPGGATSASGNTNAAMGLVSFINRFYPAPARAAEKSAYAQQGFVTAGIEGWIDSDGTRQGIVIARFTAAKGATSTLNDFTDTLGGQPAPVTMIADPADQGVGSVDPRPNADGYDSVIIAARVGDDLVEVFENSAATPDSAAAKALLLQQVNALKDGS